MRVVIENNLGEREFGARLDQGNLSHQVTQPAGTPHESAQGCITEFEQVIAERRGFGLAFPR